MIPFSAIYSAICTVKNWYVIGREGFTIRNKAAMINSVANDKSCAAIDANGHDVFKIICLYFSERYGITFCSSASLVQQLILFR